MSDRQARAAIAALALAGTGVAAYLAYVHYAGVAPVCVAGGGCETVQSSPYADLAGIPVAVAGLAVYLSILASLRLGGDAGRFVCAVLALGGLGFSAYLTYVELFVIHAVCPWCVASALIMAALAVLAAARLLGADAPPPAGGRPRSPRRPRRR